MVTYPAFFYDELILSEAIFKKISETKKVLAEINIWQ